MSSLTNSLPCGPNRVAAAPAIYTKPPHLWEMPVKSLQGPTASFWVIPGHPALLTMWWSAQPNSWPLKVRLKLNNPYANEHAGLCEMIDILWYPQQQQQDVRSEGSDPSFSLDVRDDDLFRVIWQVRFLSPLLSSGSMSASVKPKSTACNCFPPHDTQFTQLGSLNTLKTKETNALTY